MPKGFRSRCSQHLCRKTGAHTWHAAVEHKRTMSYGRSPCPAQDQLFQGMERPTTRCKEAHRGVEEEDDEEHEDEEVICAAGEGRGGNSARARGPHVPPAATSRGVHRRRRARPDVVPHWCGLSLSPGVPPRLLCYSSGGDVPQTRQTPKAGLCTAEREDTLDRKV